MSVVCRLSRTLKTELTFASSFKPVLSDSGLSDEHFQSIPICKSQSGTLLKHDLTIGLSYDLFFAYQIKAYLVAEVIAQIVINLHIS